MQKFTKQLPKEDLKKFAKEVGKKLVASDFKNNRVDDPTKVSEKQEKKVKAYVKQFFEKAVEKRKELDKRKREKEKAKLAIGSASTPSEKVNGKVTEEIDDKEDLELSPSSPSPPGAPSSPGLATPSLSFTDSPDLKRKRPVDSTSGDESDSKRVKEDEASPPPPPPPPPTDVPDAVLKENEEDAALRQQEEDLMRENAEAEAMEMEQERDGNLAAVKADALLPISIAVNGNGTSTSTMGNGGAMEGVEANSHSKHESEAVTAS